MDLVARILIGVDTEASVVSSIAICNVLMYVCVLMYYILGGNVTSTTTTTTPNPEPGNIYY